MSLFHSAAQYAVEKIVEELLEDNLKRLDNNRDRARQQTFRDVGEAMFDPGGLALAHIEHFLGCSGESLEIDPEKLLRDNPSIKLRVESEVRRRALRIKTLKESSTFSLYRDGIDPILTIFQWNFDDRDWWGALGTYEFELRRLERKTEHSESLVIVNIYGKNEYKWHTDRESVSKAIHQFGAKLVADGLAKNFWMLAKPMRRDVIGKPATDDPLADFAFAQENPKGALKQFTPEVKARLKKRLPDSFWVNRIPE